MVNGSTWYSLGEREIKVLNEVLTSDCKNLSIATLMHYSVVLRSARYRVEQQLTIAPQSIQRVLMSYDDELNTALIKLSALASAERVIKLETPDEMVNHPYIKLIGDNLVKGMDEEKAIKSAALTIGITEPRLKQFLDSHSVKVNKANEEAVKKGMLLANENANLDASGIITLARQYGYDNFLDVMDFADGYLSALNNL